MIGLFNAACNDPRIVELAHGDANQITAALETVKPVCCYLGDEVMHLVIGYAEHGEIYDGKTGPMTPPTDQP